LHAATFQEHGKVVHTLTLAGANIHIKDKGGITPIDFASISEAVWPHFSVKGAKKTSKDELLAKKIIRKIEKGESRRPESRIQSLSKRPGQKHAISSLSRSDCMPVLVAIVTKQAVSL